MPRKERGNIGDGYLGFTQAQTFVREEEESAVFANGAAKNATEIVLPDWRFGQTVVVGKPIIGVKDVVAQIVEGRAMEAVAAGTGDQDNLGAAAAVFGGGVRSFHAKLLQSIDRDQIAGASQGAQSRQSAASILGDLAGGADGKIGADAIDLKVVGVGSAAVDRKLTLLALLLRGRQNDTGGKFEQGVEAASIQGKVLYKLPVDHGADGGVGSIQQLGLCIHDYLLLSGADSQVDIKDQCLSYGEGQQIAGSGAEPRRLHIDAVRPGVEKRSIEGSIVVGVEGSFCTLRLFCDAHFRVSNGSALGILYRAGDRCGLRHERRSCKEDGRKYGDARKNAQHGSPIWTGNNEVFKKRVPYCD